MSMLSLKKSHRRSSVEKVVFIYLFFSIITYKSERQLQVKSQLKKTK